MPPASQCRPAPAPPLHQLRTHPRGRLRGVERRLARPVRDGVPAADVGLRQRDAVLLADA